MHKGNQNKDEYNNGFFINELFIIKNSGIETKENDFPAFQTECPGTNNTLDHDDKDKRKSCTISYRPFDERIIYSGRILVNGGGVSAGNFSGNDNLGIVLNRQPFSEKSLNVFITKRVADVSFLSEEAGAESFVFPLYDYPGIINRSEIDPVATGIPNFKMEIVNKIAKDLELQFIREKETGNVCFVNNNEDLRDEFKQVFLPIDLFDYIYAVLYSKYYRKEPGNNEKTDFSKIPYPHDPGIFWKLVRIGGSLRRVHLLECPAVENFMTQFPVIGDNKVSDPVYKNGSVYINSKQCFANVPEEVWNFYIGTYQPAQEWLLTRKGKYLSDEEIQKYQQIIAALSETRRLMEKAGDLLF